jgi:uncharacterized protein YndB with AHSA1/START domain
MITTVDVTPASDRELVLARLIEASPEALYRCWTEPALLEQWFAPRPLTTKVIGHDLRPGGRQKIVMKDPGGAEYPAEGVFLELVPGRKVVFTDAFEPGWIPTGRPFMAAEVTFEPQGDGRTLYTARARHWTVEAREEHEKMGFHEGWGQCAAQLAELAATL